MALSSADEQWNSIPKLGSGKARTRWRRDGKENEMKKAITIYMDDDSEVEAVSVVLCTVKGNKACAGSHATGMFNSEMECGHNAIYFPHQGKITEFQEGDQ